MCVTMAKKTVFSENNFDNYEERTFGFLLLLMTFQIGDDFV